MSSPNIDSKVCSSSRSQIKPGNTNMVDGGRLAVRIPSTKVGSLATEYRPSEQTVLPWSRVSGNTYSNFTAVKNLPFCGTPPPFPRIGAAIVPVSNMLDDGGWRGIFGAELLPFPLLKSTEEFEAELEAHARRREENKRKHEEWMRRIDVVLERIQARIRGGNYRKLTLPLQPGISKQELDSRMVARRLLHGPNGERGIKHRPQKSGPPPSAPTGITNDD